MDTVYYNLQAKKIKVSGGADLVTFVPTPVQAPTETRGEVLDFARCRQRLETKAAWQDLTQAAREIPQPEEPAGEFSQEEIPAAPCVPSRRERAESWLELCATVSIIAVSLAAVLAFLR